MHINHKLQYISACLSLSLGCFFSRTPQTWKSPSGKSSWLEKNNNKISEISDLSWLLKHESCKLSNFDIKQTKNQVSEKVLEDMLVSLNSNLFHNMKTKVMEIKNQGGKSLKFDESSAFPVAFSIVLPCGCCSQAWDHSVRERDKQIMHKKSIQPQLSLESRKAHWHASFCKGHLNGCSPGWKQWHVGSASK